MPNGLKDTTRKDVAVYIDYENLYISLRSTVGKNPNFDVIMDKCREFGRLTVTRAYADWSEFARVVTSQLFASGVEPIYVPTRKFYDAKTRSQATKNSVDIHITIDIMKMLTSDGCDSFVLVSGDRDFVPLMNQIRAAGKEVYAIGVAGCTSAELATAVDEMFYYHQLLESDEELAGEQRDVYQKMMRAVEIARARGYRATLGVIKPLMRELVVGFDERKFRNTKGVPFQKFKDLCEEAERQGFIRMSEGGDGVELFLAKDNIPAMRASEAQGRPADRAAAPAPSSRRSESRRPEPRRPAEPRRSESRSADEDDGDIPTAAPIVTLGEAATGASGASDEVDAEGSAGADAGSDTGTGRGRRRGRRGGRGRGRRGRSDAETTGESGEAEEGDEVAASADDAPDAAATESHAEESGNGSTPPRVEARREPARVAAPPARRVIESSDEDDDEEGGEISVGDAASLPTTAFDDLRSVMRTFEGRAPSQRRLIKQLKKGSVDGELKGEYKDGQFLLLVRKAIQDGVLEKISKGFYSGLRLKGEGGAEANAD